MTRQELVIYIKHDLKASVEVGLCSTGAAPVLLYEPHGIQHSD